MKSLRLPGALLLLLGASVAASCAKRADEAPSETAASQAPAPGIAPAAPPVAAEPADEAPSSIADGEEEPRAGGLPDQRDFSTLSEAETAFEQSKKELEQLVGRLDADKAIGGRAPTPLASGDARCPRACKAFESLKRAGDAICRIAGATDSRCTKASDLVKQSATRVAACGCED